MVAKMPLQTKSILSGRSWLLDNTASVQQRLGRGKKCQSQARKFPQRRHYLETVKWHVTHELLPANLCRLLIADWLEQAVRRWLASSDLEAFTMSTSTKQRFFLCSSHRLDFRGGNCTLTAEASHIEELDAQVKAIVTSKLPSWTVQHHTTNTKKYTWATRKMLEDVGHILGRLPREVLETRRPEATPWLRKDRKS